MEIRELTLYQILGIKSNTFDVSRSLINGSSSGSGGIDFNLDPEEKQKILEQIKTAKSLSEIESLQKQLEGRRYKGRASDAMDEE